MDEGRKQGLTNDERKELVALRRDKRRLETENEILRRAAALFARDGIVRQFTATGPDRLWLTDITQPRQRDLRMDRGLVQPRPAPLGA